MKIRDFRIAGQYPQLSVETEIEEGPSSGGYSHPPSHGNDRPDSPDSQESHSTTLTLGPWDYVSLLSEKELKSLVHLVYERRKHNPTKAMNALRGSSLEDASQVELP